ncbi:leucine-rich repeat transmembrane protein FLRT1-like [Pomacea canaliculata]|nr:leucine-rich repeat transmembrane protein FLRT1-like [Pomacea canaliculata]
MRSLEDLDLSENAINDILENVFARLKHLKKLDLSRNAIVKIADGAFRGLEYSLESLDLHRNYLETVSVCAMEGLQRLGDLRLKENPLICDCRVTWLHNWVQMTFQEHHRHLLEWTCTGPAHLDQRSFGSLSLSDLQCRNLTENTPTVACNWTTTEPYSYSVDANPAYVNVLPTPIMPLDLLGARVHVHVEPKSKSAILVRWSVNSTSKLSGCRLVVRRSNDSVEETDVTFSGDVTRHLVIGLSEGVLYETCVTALDGNEVPVGRDCSESKTVNGTTVMKVFHDPAPVSFTTLMSTYIVGCLMASTLCVFLAVAMRRRRETKKCGRSFLPGYSAWGGPRFSVPSHSSAATSTCYFNAPSISSFEEDGLVVTIGGLSGDAGVAGEFGGESVDGVIDTNSCDDGARELVAPDAGDVSSRGSGSGGDYYLGNGRCSTVSSFRRHLPANYIVTNTDISDDFFFHF